jgi:stage II sporulation protein D
MRSFALRLACVVSFWVLTGCAVGLQAETRAPAVNLPANPETVRIRILYTRLPSTLSCTGPYRFQLHQGGKSYVRRSSIKVCAMRTTMVFGQTSFKGEMVAMPDSSTDTLKLNGRRYRGLLVFHPLGIGRYDVVEYLSVEEYVYGVLPREVEIAWPLDALKAQAVVSRTYVLYNKEKQATERYDVLDSVHDQVYGGEEVEAPSTTQAVNDTRGEILVDPTGKPVQAFFHSSCGGHTERPEHVWKSSNDPDVFGVISDGSYCSEDPHYKWQLTLGYNVLRAKLKRAGFRIRDIKKISVLQKSESGRVEVFNIETSRGEIEVGGNRFRLAIGPELLRSTLLTNMKVGKKSVYFEGRGWGHGVGLCQWGARGRALAGQHYKDILQTYYPKAKLTQASTGL